MLWWYNVCVRMVFCYYRLCCFLKWTRTLLATVWIMTICTIHVWHIHANTLSDIANIFVVCHLSFVNWLCFSISMVRYYWRKGWNVIFRYHPGISMSLHSCSNSIYILSATHILSHKHVITQEFYPNVVFDNSPSDGILFFIVDPLWPATL